MICIMKVGAPPIYPDLPKLDTDRSVTGEGHFGDEASNKPSGTATPIDAADLPAAPGKRPKGTSKKAKTLKQKLAVADGL